MLLTILLIILILIAIGSLPTLGSPYGWYPPGGIALVILILLIVLLVGR